MRHAKKGFKLNRTASHRKATLAALSVALIQHKRITTTVTKAKALRIFVEPLITRARVDTTQNRRQVFRRLMDKHAVTELFEEISEKVGDRPGGYTRVVRIGQRQGDSAELAVIELVDYNDSNPEDQPSRRRTRRSRRRRSGGTPQPEVSGISDSNLSEQESEDNLSLSEDEEDVSAAAETVEPEISEVDSQEVDPESVEEASESPKDHPEEREK